jgi:pyruvate dehydrogenase E2 component (dihydrolipoamide acetyltransferase)
MGDFTMPSLGADMEAGTLVEWMIKPGDIVKRGDTVAVVETQKGAIEVEIFEDGRVEALLVDPGTTVPVGTVLARIAGEQPATGAAPAPAPSPPAPHAAVPPTHSAGLPTPASSPQTSVAPTATVPAASASTQSVGRVRASPAARARARALGLPLESIAGTGPSGAISIDDVQHAANASSAKSASPRPGMRQAIAAAMSRSKREIPHYYLSTRIDVGPTLDWLRKHNELLKPADRLLPLVPLLKAVALATKKVPEVNGFYEHGAFRPGTGAHIGVAVSLREGGLIVPALHDVATKPVDVLGRELADLIERARRGQLKSSELFDSTITVTSLGARGVEEVFGVIFPPQVALVGFGAITDMPWVLGGTCLPRPTVTASLAADHRVSDGHRGGLFLAEISSLLQNPEAL